MHGNTNTAQQPSARSGGAPGAAPPPAMALPTRAPPPGASDQTIRGAVPVPAGEQAGAPHLTFGTYGVGSPDTASMPGANKPHVVGSPAGPGGIGPPPPQGQPGVPLPPGAAPPPHGMGHVPPQFVGVPGGPPTNQQAAAMFYAHHAAQAAFMQAQAAAAAAAGGAPPGMMPPQFRGPPGMAPPPAGMQFMAGPPGMHPSMGGHPMGMSPPGGARGAGAMMPGPPMGPGQPQQRMMPPGPMTPGGAPPPGAMAAPPPKVVTWEKPKSRALKIFNPDTHEEVKVPEKPAPPPAPPPAAPPAPAPGAPVTAAASTPAATTGAPAAPAPSAPPGLAKPVGMAVEIKRHDEPSAATASAPDAVKPLAGAPPPGLTKPAPAPVAPVAPATPAPTLPPASTVPPAAASDGPADANGSGAAGGLRKPSVVRKAALERAETTGDGSGLYDAYSVAPPKPAPAAAATAPPPGAATVAAPVRVKAADEPVEADSWEDVADGSTPVIGGHVGDGGRVPSPPEDGSRVYSRDWLLSLRDKCQHLPDQNTMAAVVDADLLDREGRSLAGVPSGQPRNSTGGGGPGGRLGGPPGGGDDKWAHKAMQMGTPTGANRGGGQGRAPGTPAEMAAKWERGRVPPPLPGDGNGDARGGRRGGRGGDGGGPTPGGGYPAHLIPAHVRAAPVMPLHKAEAKYVLHRDVDEDAGKQRAFKGILNKLTPQTFDKMVEQTLALGITAAHHLEGFVDQLFSKALVEPTFCETYAMLCASLQARLVEPPPPGADAATIASLPPKALEFEKEDPNSETGVVKITFKRVLLNKCQEEFERGDARIKEAMEDTPPANGAGDDAASAQPREPGEITPEKPAASSDVDAARKAAQREERVMMAKRIMFGNIRFIGELFKVRMLTDKIMHACVQKLLGEQDVTPDEESVEAVCKLMTTIGAQLETGRPETKPLFNSYFVRCQQLSQDQALSSRHRFMLADLLDMRNNRWRARRKQEGPKKIEDVHRDAAMEAAKAERAGGGRDRGGGGGGGGSGDARRSSASSGRPGMEVYDRGGRGGQAAGMRGGPVDGGPPPAGPMRRGLEQDGGLTLGPKGGFASSASAPRAPPPAPRPGSGAAAVPPARTSSGSMPAPRAAGAPPGLAGPKAAAAAPPTAKPATPEPCMSEEELTTSIKQVASYFADDSDVAAADAQVRQWHMPPDGPEALVLHLVMDAYDRKRYDWEALHRLLVQLTTGSPPALPPASLARALRRLYDGLEDAACDLPAAPQRLGEVTGALVHARCVTFTDVATTLLEASPEGDPPGGLRNAGMALDALAAVLRGIESAGRAAALAAGAEAEAADAQGAGAMAEIFRAAVSAGLTLRAFADDDTAANARDEADLAQGCGLGDLFPLAPVAAHVKASLQNGEPAAEVIAWLEERIPTPSRSDPEYARLVVTAVLSRAAPPLSACSPEEVCAPDAYGPLLRHVTAGKPGLRVGAVLGAQTVCQEANHPAGLGVSLLDALWGCGAIDMDALTKWADDTKDTGPAKRKMLMSVNTWIMERRLEEEREGEHEGEEEEDEDDEAE